VIAAQGLKVTAISNVTDPLADQIALWPNDEHPTHLFMAVETGRNAAGTNASLQVVDLSGNPNSNVRTVLTGLTSADPVRRTPWGTILVGEEAGDGAMYEIFDPLHVGVGTPAMITNRATGASTDPAHIFKRQALGALAYEGLGILPDGTTYYGDERRPGPTIAGGSIYKYVPDPAVAYAGLPVTTGVAAVSPAGSPYAIGKIYGMRLGTNSGNTDNGQGTEIGKGVWVPVSAAPDANGNIDLRAAADALHLTGYYRPEDMDLDEAALAQGVRRVCWTNTGRMSNGGNSIIEEAATYGEVMCLVDEPKTGVATDYRPSVTRFYAGGADANYFDNIDFQPKTGRMVLLEDGEVEVVTSHGTEFRGNDVWMLLPDGGDRDVQSDGAIKILSLTDTDAEPTGWIFDASGETAYVNIQHRAPGIGAVLMITGFKVKE
jgi:secreted PhoX family phosphatase